MRAVGVIIRNGKVLLLRRIKNGQEYYCFPGGGIEKGETAEITMKREIKEELSLDVQSYEKLFDIVNLGGREFYFLVKNYSGEPRLGGPEKERMNEQNQYYIEWIDFSELGKTTNLYPEEAVKRLFQMFSL